MATGDLDTNAATPLDVERANLEQRCSTAEEQVRQLRRELDEVRAQLAAVEAERAAQAEATGLSLFDRDDTGPASDRLTGDGSDPRILSLTLAATAVVAAMVVFLTLINGKLLTPFGLVIVLIAIALAWGAARTRVQPVEVSITRGIVYVDRGDSSYRFDIRNGRTAVEMLGRPGDSGWQVRFARRHMEPFVIDASMVDPHEFTRQLREHLPHL